MTDFDFDALTYSTDWERHHGDALREELGHLEEDNPELLELLTWIFSQKVEDNVLLCFADGTTLYVYIAENLLIWFSDQRTVEYHVGFQNDKPVLSLKSLNDRRTFSEWKSVVATSHYDQLLEELAIFDDIHQWLYVMETSTLPTCHFEKWLDVTLP